MNKSIAVVAVFVLVFVLVFICIFPKKKNNRILNHLDIVTLATDLKGRSLLGAKDFSVLIFVQRDGGATPYIEINFFNSRWAINYQVVKENGDILDMSCVLDAQDHVFYWIAENGLMRSVVIDEQEYHDIVIAVSEYIRHSNDDLLDVDELRDIIPNP